MKAGHEGGSIGRITVPKMETKSLEREKQVHLNIRGKCTHKYYQKCGTDPNLSKDSFAHPVLRDLRGHLVKGFFNMIFFSF